MEQEWGLPLHPMSVRILADYLREIFNIATCENIPEKQNLRGSFEWADIYVNIRH